MQSPRRRRPCAECPRSRVPPVVAVSSHALTYGTYGECCRRMRFSSLVARAHCLAAGERPSRRGAAGHPWVTRPAHSLARRATLGLPCPVQPDEDSRRSERFRRALRRSTQRSSSPSPISPTPSRPTPSSAGSGIIGRSLGLPVGAEPVPGAPGPRRGHDGDHAVVRVRAADQRSARDSRRSMGRAMPTAPARRRPASSRWRRSR